MCHRVRTGNVIQVNNTGMMTARCCGNTVYETGTHRCCDNKHIVSVTSSTSNIGCCTGAPQGDRHAVLSLFVSVSSDGARCLKVGSGTWKLDLPEAFHEVGSPGAFPSPRKKIKLNLGLAEMQFPAALKPWTYCMCFYDMSLWKYYKVGSMNMLFSVSLPD